MAAGEIRTGWLKPWRCERGHVLGMTGINGEGTRRLILYRNAIGEEKDEDVEVLTEIRGVAVDVRCSICGDIRTWVARRVG